MNDSRTSARNTFGPRTCAHRQLLLTEIERLEAEGITCVACLGECCTSKSNSMKINMDEAGNILDELLTKGLWAPELIQVFQDCIRGYRLDIEIASFGSRPNLRRTFTCPLYSPGANGPFGCLLSREARPLGCLAFNPVAARASGLSSGCRSDVKLLALQTGDSSLSLSPSPSPSPEKWPIPVAVLRTAEAWGLCTSK